MTTQQQRKLSLAQQRQLPKESLSPSLSGVIALILGYMHQKQMRQIEAFRQNPDVGLIPPPHGIVLSYQKHRPLIILVLLAVNSIIGLILVLRHPLSLLSVVAIAVFVAGLMSLPSLAIIGRLMSAVEGILKIMALMHEVLRKGDED